MMQRQAFVAGLQQREFDFIVVGAGSAGAVLASRLSEDPARSVLLVEAGADTPASATPADIDDTFPSSTLNPGYFWPGLNVRLRRNGAPRLFPQARVVGGGSSIMGMIGLRGVPSDFERWAHLGVRGLSWDDAVRVYRKLEADPDRTHCPPGRYPLTRTPAEEWPGYVRAMREVATARGMPYIADINEEPADGVFPMPVARRGDVRSTSARYYLTDEVRRRPNLSILAAATVTKVLFRGVRARGVRVSVDSCELGLRSRNVAICAGAIFSPALLMRSGVGPGDHLMRHGIPVMIDRQGVGSNLQNHWYLSFGLTLPKAGRMAQSLRRFALAGLRASSGLPGCPPSDLFLFMLGRVSGRSFGAGLGMVAAALYSPFSKGEVRLAAADHRIHPDVDFNMMNDPLDAPRMVRAARLAESLIRHPAVAAEYNDAFLLPSVMSVQQFNRPGLAGAVTSLGARMVLASPSALRRAAFLRGLPGSKPVFGDHTVSDEDILQAVAPMGHPAGTCAMGSASDPEAVVDENYRVIGAEGLYVVDASVMPVIPSANTNLPTMMLGEHASERIALQLEEVMA